MKLGVIVLFNYSYLLSIVLLWVCVGKCLPQVSGTFRRVLLEATNVATSPIDTKQRNAHETALPRLRGGNHSSSHLSSPHNSLNSNGTKHHNHHHNLRHNNNSSHANRVHNVTKHHSHHHHRFSIFDKSFVGQGNPSLVPGISIHGAIILSDHFFHDKQKINTSSQQYTDQLKMISARIHNYNVLQSQLPFNLTKWSAVVAGPCPHYPTGHRTERGLAWAHYRIWRDFAYFDYELIQQHQNQSEHGLLSSDNGLYVIYPNGTMYKDGIPFLDDDIIAIFEDDAISAINQLNITLQEEFSDMKVDMLFLGWCEGRAARPVPLCTHAYAITRRGAQKLIKYYEPCGRAVDEQFVIIAKNGWLKYRRAHPFSYKVLRPDFNGHGDKTYGIFRQCKSTCGSMLGH